MTTLTNETFLFDCLETSIARPLGMQDRSIERSQISFSSAHNDARRRWESPWLNPDSGQLNGHAWVPHYNNEEQWLQVDFLRSTKVTEIKTQGRSIYQQWVTSYEIAFGNDGENFRFCQRYGKNEVNDCAKILIEIKFTVNHEILHQQHNV